MLYTVDTETDTHLAGVLNPVSVKFEFCAVKLAFKPSKIHNELGFHLRNDTRNISFVAFARKTSNLRNLRK